MVSRQAKQFWHNNAALSRDKPEWYQGMTLLPGTTGSLDIQMSVVG
jgi:hypothetical protein